METRLLMIQALSPIHAGTGQGVGVIDQPIAREKATGIPFLPGSTLKGVFRDACSPNDRESIFGSDVNGVELYQGAVTFTDARLLLLPVRSLRGVFAWVTSPLLLNRLARDAKDIKGLSVLPAFSALPKDDECLVAEKDSSLSMSFNKKNMVVLEDLELTAKPAKDVNDLAEWIKKAFALDSQARLCIVSDDTLSFLLETATEVTARIRIEDKTKTVADGALWYEEALPVETVLMSMVVASKESKKVFDAVQGSATMMMQFGGNATVGRGLCKVSLAGG